VKRLKIIKIIFFPLIILSIGYFYAVEFKKNWTELQNFKLIVNGYYLIAALLVILLSYLLETISWKVGINKHLGRGELNFAKSIAIVNTSGLFKYLPGRIWVFTAQLAWLKKYNISKSIILHVNMICILASAIVSLFLGLIYLALYTNFMTMRSLILALGVLILFNIFYIVWNPLLINKLASFTGRLLKREIKPLNASRSLVLLVQFIYLCNSALMGFGVYFLAKGIGLPIRLTDIYPILASMSVAWLVGYVAIISPGGLGIREGMMLLMLNNVVNMETALIFPILSRVMYLIAEALLGLAALLLGLKYGMFSLKAGAGDQAG
jgi:uncharacterized membrane protein YbhN (UPF0104 family)